MKRETQQQQQHQQKYLSKYKWADGHLVIFGDASYKISFTLTFKIRFFFI